MAGDWIKMRTDLRDDPAVFRIAALTQLDRFNIVGRLAAFWGWIDKHAVDGRVDGGSISAVDDVVSFPGFSAALQSVGWLVVDGDSVYIPHHEKHNAESGKERTLKNARQARWRAKQAEKALQKVDDFVDGNVDVSLSTKASTREEKRREDISSSLRSEDSAATTQRAPSRSKREEVTLAKYLQNCKQAGVKPVPDDHAIRSWCADAKIPVEMLQVAWVVFREKYLGDEKLKGKRYKDWAGHFANSVKDRWHGLWFIGDDGNPAWTSTGLQRKQVLEAHMKSPSEVSHEPA